MEKPIRVAFYGDSLFINGIAKSLEGAPNLEVVRIHPDTPEACLSLEGIGAGLLAFNIHDAPPEMMLALFKETPNLTLLALDPEGDRLLVLSSEPARVATTDDLLQVIRFYGSGSPVYGGKPSDTGPNFNVVDKIISNEEI